MTKSKDRLGMPFVGFCTILACAVPTLVTADPAKTTWTGYLYQGPGYRYSVADEVPQASRVDVGHCANGWCRVVFGDRIGYLRAEIVTRGSLDKPGEAILAQPAAAVRNVPPPGPCVEANQTGGNGGNAMTVFCRK